MRRYDEACVPKIIYDFEWIPLQCFELYAMIVLAKNKLLFIHIWDLCDMWYSVMWLTLIYLKKFLRWKNGVLHRVRSWIKTTRFKLAGEEDE